MASAALLPPFDQAHDDDAVGHELQTVRQELTSLPLIAEQLHRAVVGPLARTVHLDLDGLIDSWHELADTIAERTAAVDSVPDGQLQATATGPQLSSVEHDTIDDNAAVGGVARRAADVAKRVRLRRAGEVDRAWHEVPIDVLRAREKQQWVLRAQIKESA